MAGVFITFEGIEGSGKSTQIALLRDHLVRVGRTVVLTREPGGTPIGDQIRKVLLDPANKAMDPSAELLLYAASRSQHLHEVIIPALKKGAMVLCDRFSDATLAYQGYGRGLSIAMIRDLDRIVTAGLRPRLTVLLDIDAKTGVGRARGRNASQNLHAEARFENEAVEFHSRVRDGYLALARAEPARFRLVAAGGTPEAIHGEVKKVVDELLAKE